MELNSTLASRLLKCLEHYSVQACIQFNNIFALLLCLHFNYKGVTVFKLQNVRYLTVNDLSIILGRYIDELPQNHYEDFRDNCFTKTY